MAIDYGQQQWGEDIFEPTYSSTDEQGNPIYDYVAPPLTPAPVVAPLSLPPVVQETPVTQPVDTVSAPTGGLPVTQDVATSTTPNNQLSGVILAGASWMAGDEKTDLANQAFGQNVTNTAVGGQKTSDVLNQLNVFERDGGTFAPGSTVVLDVGANDIAQGVDRNTITNNLNEIVSRLGTKGVNVILSGQPNASSYDDAISRSNLQMDDLYSNIAKNNSNVTLVDAMSGMLNKKDLMDESGFHLKDDASKLQYLNQFADVYKNLNASDKVALDNKLSTIDTSNIAAVAQAVDDVAGTNLSATATEAPIGGLPTTKPPTITLTSSDGKTYSGDTLLKLAQQLGATKTASNLAGSAYGLEKGNIGFYYT